MMDLLETRYTASLQFGKTKMMRTQFNMKNRGRFS